MKPTIYIDQNVLSYLKDKVFKFPTTEFQCVYSTTHFQEIPNDNRNMYFETLDQIDAALIKVNTNEHNELLDTGNFIYHHPVMDLFNDLDETAENTNCESIFDPLLSKLAGGKDVFEGVTIPSQLFESLDIFVPENPQLSGLTNSLKDLMAEISNALIMQLKNVDPIEIQRSKLGTDKGKLLEISSEDTIVAIGEKIKINTGIDMLSLISQQFGSKSTYTNVIIMNMLLNFVGYNADKKLGSLRKIPNIRRDGKHMANAIFCHFVLSEDRRFVEKARAIYEYLNVNTKVIKLSREN